MPNPCLLDDRLEHDGKSRAENMTRRPLWHTLTGLIMACAAANPAHAFRVDYTIDVTAEDNDNLLLTPDNRIGLTVLRPGVGFGLHQDSSTFQAEFSGRAEYRHYGDARFDNTIDGTLTGHLNWVAVPERLSFSVTDSLTLQPVNTLAADTPGNRQQVNVLSVGPTLLFQWSPRWHGAAELRYVRSDAEVTEEFNSDRIDLGLRTTRELSETSRLGINAQMQNVDFEDDLIARDYMRHSLFARYSRTLSKFDLTADAGYSRLDYRRDLPGFASTRTDPLLRLGLGWRPNDSHHFSLQVSSQFSDLASDSLLEAVPQTLTPNDVTTGDTVVNASPFLERRLDGEYAYASTRWTLGFSPYLDRLRYSDTDEFDQDGHGAGFEVSWLARHNLRFGAAAAYDSNKYLRIDRSDETRRLTAYARYDWTRHWFGTLSVSRYSRESTAFGQNADQNVIMLSVSYSNR